MKTQNEVKHTETPWNVDRNSDGYLWVTDSDNNIGIARLSRPDDEANAEFIVRAANAHNDLFAACVAARSRLNKDFGDFRNRAFVKGQIAMVWPEIEMLTNAIKKAEGKGE